MLRRVYVVAHRLPSQYQLLCTSSAGSSPSPSAPDEKLSFCCTPLYL